MGINVGVETMKGKYGMMGLGEDKTWNMDDAFCQRINERLNDFDVASCNADQYARYRILYTIFLDTHFKYHDDIAQLKVKFKTISSSFGNHSQSMDKRVQQQHQAVVFSAIEEKINELAFEIIKLLYDNDLIYLKKTEQKMMPTETWS